MMYHSFEKSIERLNIVKYNIGKLENLLCTWNTHLPGIRPYYAVKCNNNPQIITKLAELGCGFDCASQKEMELVKKYAIESNHRFKMSDDIIFANPCKYVNEVKWANDNKIKMTTFDSVYEIEKFGENFKFDYILRIHAKDEQAACQMDKYGALENEWEHILEKCENLGINLVGVSFHVGSDAKQSSAYEKAIRNASTVFEMAKYHGLGDNMHVLDIGGGFSEETIAKFGPIIMQCINDNFQKYDMKLIAEPGRYFAANIATLYTQIVGKRIRNGVTQYFVSDGIYGSFNCQFFDHKYPKPMHAAFDGEDSGSGSDGETTNENEKERETEGMISAAMEEIEKKMVKCTIYGPTCDGLDHIVKECMYFDKQIGDYIAWDNMGAYTFAAASDFNGMNLMQPHIEYIH